MSPLEFRGKKEILSYTHQTTQAIKELKVEIDNIVLSLKKGQAIRITVKI